MLPERKGFKPGRIIGSRQFHDILESQESYIYLNEKQREVSVTLPVFAGIGTYALICRSRGLKEDEFNSISVMVGDEWIGNYYPCTKTFTNKKLLWKGNGESVEVKLRLRDGTGCLIDVLRVYRADVAYAITQLVGSYRGPGTKVKYVKPEASFKRLAIETAKWIERRGDRHGLRMLVKRTAIFGDTPE